MKVTFELLWAAVGLAGSSSRYFHTVIEGERPFIVSEFLMFISSGSFVAWLCAKTTVVFLKWSVDVAFIVAGLSGVLGFSASVNILDRIVQRDKLLSKNEK